MTEKERIIAEGILPESFFKEETRCEYCISEKMKKIWAVEIDLYFKFAEICNKHHLTYWADGGTMLGAVRHRGFIPWDDDLDVTMPRADYEKFIEIAPKELAYPYFLQTPYTDSGYAYSFIKMRNSNTTCIPEIFIKAGFNHGIFLDIFPLDFLDLQTFEDEKRQIGDCIKKLSSYMKRNSVEMLSPKQLEVFQQYQTSDPIVEYETIQRLASNPKYIGSEWISDRVVNFLPSEAMLWKSAWFEETEVLPFESFEIPLPKKYDSRLKAQFGDYMKFPPVEKRGNWHSGVIWDPDKSYTEYIDSEKTKI